MMVKFQSVLMAFGLAAGLAPAALADGDSSADASAGFVQSVETSEAVMIRVPVNAAGQELTDAAEMRLYHGEDLSTSTASFVNAFEVATPVSDQPEVDVDADSSTTFFGYGWNRWRYRGYHYNYYYSYRPTYYYGGYRYNYYAPYYYNYGGYRYYYYGRCW